MVFQLLETIFLKSKIELDIKTKMKTILKGRFLYVGEREKGEISR